MPFRRRKQKADEDIAPWWAVMKSLTGTTEAPGDPDNPKIVGMADYIANKWAGDPAMDGIENYCAGYVHDSTPWCGLTEAYCLSVAGIRPPFDKTDDTGSFLWAQSFANDPGFVHLAQPRPGCIVVMTREGGGHVTTWEGQTNGSNTCRGGNQSDAVNVQNYSKGDVIAYVWPRDYPLPPAEQRTISEGDTGGDVAQCQRILKIPADGEFGPTTEGAVKGFQSGADLDVDGEVGPQTWAALDELDSRRNSGVVRLSQAEISAVTDIARASPLMTYQWPDRGRSPAGYIVGMALCFGDALKREDALISDISQADRDDPDEDVLSWFGDDLNDLEWDVSEDGVDTMKALFAIMIGLGMRESSGRYSEGRDQSASNTSADTAEASLFQTSWNIRSCTPTIPPLLNEFKLNPNGYIDAFREDVTPNGTELQNYGAGSDGAAYQFLSKNAPLFHVYVSACGLRHLRQHWGPVNRNEVTLRQDAYDLLTQVEAVIETGVLPPEPEPGTASVNVGVTARGDVNTKVNGTNVPSTAAGDPGVSIAIETSGQVAVSVAINGQPWRG